MALTNARRRIGAARESRRALHLNGDAMASQAARAMLDGQIGRSDLQPQRAPRAPQLRHGSSAVKARPGVPNAGLARA